MATSNDPLIVQLEDGLLVGALAIGGILGGFLMVSFAPEFLGFLPKFILGGVVGSVGAYLPTAIVFRLINPTRDRSSKPKS